MYDLIAEVAEIMIGGQKLIMDSFLLDILRDSKHRSDESRKLKCTDVDLQGKTADLMSCKNCNRRFKLLNQHLAHSNIPTLLYSPWEKK